MKTQWNESPRGERSYCSQARGTGTLRGRDCDRLRLGRASWVRVGPERFMSRCLSCRAPLGWGGYPLLRLNLEVGWDSENIPGWFSFFLFFRFSSLLGICLTYIPCRLFSDKDPARSSWRRLLRTPRCCPRALPFALQMFFSFVPR